MKSLFASAIIATGLSLTLLAPSPVWAQSTTRAQMDALNDMVAWTQASAERRVSALSLFK